MLIVMRPDATPEQVDSVVAKIRELGLTPHPIPGANRTAIGITGNKGAVTADAFELMAGVAETIAVSQPFKLVSREVKPNNTIVDVDGVQVGGASVVLMAGPCAVESEEQL